MEAAVPHRRTEPTALGQVLSGQRPCASSSASNSGVERAGHLVKARAHVDLVAQRVEQGHVHRHAEAVDGAAGRLGQIQAERCAGQLGPGRSCTLGRRASAQAGDSRGGAARATWRTAAGCSRLAALVAAVEAVVDRVADEVVAGGVAQVDGDIPARRARGSRGGWGRPRWGWTGPSLASLSVDPVEVHAAGRRHLEADRRCAAANRWSSGPSGSRDAALPDLLRLLVEGDALLWRRCWRGLR